MRVGRRFGAVVLAGILAGSTAPAGEPTLVKRLGSDRFRQRDSVLALTYSPDHKHVVTTEVDAIHQWDAADGRRLWTIPAPNHTFNGLRFAPDGKTLHAVAESGGHTRLARIDPARGKLLDNRLLVTAPAKGWFSPDATWVALKQMDGKRVWIVEVATGRVGWSDRAENLEKFEAVAFRPDGKVLAVGDFDKRIRLVDPAAGKVIAEYKVGGGVAWNMAFSPDGKDLVAEISSPAPNHVLRFEAATGQVRWQYETGRAKELAFGPEGARIYYYGSPGPDRTGPTGWHWLDAATGKPTGETMDADWFEAAARPDGKVLAVGGLHGHVSQLDLATRQPLQASADPPGPVTDLRFSPDGSKVRGWSGGWYEWDVTTGAQARLSPRTGFRIPPLSTASDDQRWLVMLARGPGSDDWHLHLIDLRTGERRHTVPGADFTDTFRFLPDGRLAVTGPSGLRLFDPATGKVRLTVSTDEKAMTAVSADGAVAAVVGRDGDRMRATRWDLRAGRPTADWSVPVAGGLERLAVWDRGLSDDGRRLLVQFTVAESPVVRRTRVGVFDLVSGRKVSDWELPIALVPTFSPDGRAVALRSPSVFGIELRETATGQRRFPGSFAHKPRACRFSPDGRYLAVSAAPGPVELWDLVGRPAWDPKLDLWAALASPDATAAYAAIQVARSHPAEAIPVLKARVTVPPTPAADWVAARIKDLDSPMFRDRERATKELTAAGEAVVGALRDALPRAPAEARERLTALIARAEAPSPEKLRLIRACEALEGIGTLEAKELLAAWAKGPPGATLTREAAESLERLKRRSVGAPL